MILDRKRNVQLGVHIQSVNNKNFDRVNCSSKTLHFATCTIFTGLVKQEGIGYGKRKFYYKVYASKRLGESHARGMQGASFTKLLLR